MFPKAVTVEGFSLLRGGGGGNIVFCRVYFCLFRLKMNRFDELMLSFV